MAYCTNCRQDLPQGITHCPNCGSPVAEGEPPAPQEGPAPEPTSAAAGASVTSDPISQDARNMTVLLHLSAFAGFITAIGYIVGPLLVWLLKREDSPFIDSHGKEALNFHISMTIYAIISVVLILVAIGIVMLIGLLLLWLSAVIASAVRASNGQEPWYPLKIRFLK